MFVMSAAESQRSAEITNIYNNLRNLSVAGLAYYADNVGKDFDKDLTAVVKAYTQNLEAVKNADGYFVVNDKTNKIWWAAYWVREPDSFKTRLAARASSLGLLGTNNNVSNGTLPDPKSGTYAKNDFALMKIRQGNR